jgi:hypothetical protein
MKEVACLGVREALDEHWPRRSEVASFIPVSFETSETATGRHMADMTWAMVAAALRQTAGRWFLSSTRH